MDKLTEIITCETAAQEVRDRLGFVAHGPATAKLVERLDACKGCHGSPRLVILSHVFETVAADKIMALRN